jgi:hypothetical protein
MKSAIPEGAFPAQAANINTSVPTERIYPMASGTR